MEWQTQHDEVEIEDLEANDLVIWPPREKSLEVQHPIHHMENINGENIHAVVHYKDLDEWVVVGPRDAYYVLRRKYTGDGYMLENYNSGHRVESMDTIYRV